MTKSLLICLLLPTLAFGAYYRFDPSIVYNLDNVETAADTVFLKWWYEGDSSGVRVITSPVPNTTGMYQFDSTVAEAGNYLVRALVSDVSAGVYMSETFIFTAKDTVDAAGSSPWSEAEVDSALGAITDVNKANFKATGFSTFDHTTDKVTLVDTSADGIHDAEIAALEGLDSAGVIHAKLFNLGLADSSVTGDSNTTLGIQKGCEQAISGSFIFDNDSVVVDGSAFAAQQGIFNSATWDSTSLDSLLTWFFVGALSIGDTVWTHANRQLTRFDEDSTVIEIDSSAFSDDYWTAIDNASGAGSGDSNTTAGIVKGCANAIDSLLGDTLRGVFMDSTELVQAVAGETYDTMSDHAAEFSDTNEAATSSAQIDTLHVLLTHADSLERFKASGFSTFDPDTDTVTAHEAASGGEYQFTVFCYDSSNTEIVADAEVTVRNESETSQRWLLHSNANGNAAFMLDSGTYSFGGSGTREMSGIDTISLASDSTDTLYFYTNSVTLGGSPTKCTVYGSIYSGEGIALEGVRLFFVLPGPCTDTAAGKPLSTEEHVCWTDSDGNFSIDLVKTGNLLPEGKLWSITIWHEEHFRIPWTAKFSIPASLESLDISDIGAAGLGY